MRRGYFKVFEKMMIYRTTKTENPETSLKMIEKVYLDRLMKTEDATEGLKAFIEKRKPTWKDQ